MAPAQRITALLAFLLIAPAYSQDTLGVHVPHQTPGDRIIGGKEAEPHSAPYVTFLAMRTMLSMYQCGGSLISPNYVLTAAHCLKNKLDGLVILGAHNISQEEDTQVSLRVNSLLHFKIHPSADIALIKLPHAVDTNANIKPVKLPSRDEAFKSYENEIATAVGWGLVHNHPDRPSDVLRTVNVEVLPRSKCTDNPNEVCTSGKGVRGTCNGDSGGPLLVNGTQIGITSWGAAECELGYPSVYVFVNNYLDWIVQNTDVVID